MGRYLEHQINEVEYWKPRLIEKTGNAFADIKNEIKYSFNTLKSKKVVYDNFGQTVNLGSKIDYSLGCIKSEILDVKTPSFVETAEDIGGILKSENKVLASLTSPEACKVQKARNEVLKAFYMSIQSGKDNRYLNTFTSSIYGMFSTQDYRQKLLALEASEERSHIRQHILQEKLIAASLLDLFENMSNNTFDTILNRLKNNFWEYKDMNNFNIKVDDSGIAAAKKYTG